MERPVEGLRRHINGGSLWKNGFRGARVTPLARRHYRETPVIEWHCWSRIKQTYAMFSAAI